MRARETLAGMASDARFHGLARWRVQLAAHLGDPGALSALTDEERAALDTAPPWIDVEGSGQVLADPGTFRGWALRIPRDPYDAFGLLDRAATAALRALLPRWEARRPGDDLLRRAVESLARASSVGDSDDDELSALTGRAHAVERAGDPAAAEIARLVEELVGSWHEEAEDRAERAVEVVSRAAELAGEEAVRAAIRAALLPWLLDPARTVIRADDQGSRIRKRDGTDAGYTLGDLLALRPPVGVDLDLAGSLLGRIPGARFVRCDLRGADVEDARRATLRECDLREVGFQHCGLQGADLRGSDLRGANLAFADLRGADLRGVDLRRTPLENADLRGANLEGARLEDAELGGARLANANLGGADLREASLRNADLPGAILSGADLSGADLFRADLAGADLSRAKLVGARLGTDERPWWQRVADSLRGRSTESSSIDLRRLLGDERARRPWPAAHLKGARLLGADLRDANLRGAILAEADLAGADLAGADLHGADLSGARLPEGFAPS